MAHVALKQVEDVLGVLNVQGLVQSPVLPQLGLVSLVTPAFGHHIGWVAGDPHGHEYYSHQQPQGD